MQREAAFYIESFKKIHMQMHIIFLSCDIVVFNHENYVHSLELMFKN